ncbi:MAG TPA: hypothetical protein VFZ08_05590 [Terriglobia bacterium]|nr:hypothetical protein [Terriglobia bacterium]
MPLMVQKSVADHLSKVGFGFQLSAFGGFAEINSTLTPRNYVRKTGASRQYDSQVSAHLRTARDRVKKKFHGSRKFQLLH